MEYSLINCIYGFILYKMQQLVWTHENNIHGVDG